ncbi:transcriptional regulator [Streptomyces sp. NPDC048057]|uniref:transcriptional regulator n=1 Tax=Streptomyces sp. NPDC048057 TaxID=3155628 RepID=UPI0033EEC845
MSSDAHPLVYLLRLNSWSANDYLARLDRVHQQLGYGPIVRDRKRITRWTRHGVTPDRHAQKAMAALHGIPAYEIVSRPWPEWLKVACIRDRDLLDAPWTPEATMELADRVATTGGSMDRRGFLVVTGVTPVLGGSAIATTVEASEQGRRIGASTSAVFEQSLEALRRQDDLLGSGQVHASARAQLQLIIRTLKNTAYTETTGRRLYSAAAEAARICGWTAHDSGHHGLAEEYYLVALRAAASAGDHVTTANTLAFWSGLRSSSGDPRSASDLVTHALRRTTRIGSPRMTAMLYTKLARAHSHAGEQRASAHALNTAFDAYDSVRDCRPEEDPDCVYWMDLGELYMQAGSCELSLGRPQASLRHFTAAASDLRTADAHDEDAFPRDAVIYLAREAEARVALGDLDGAVDTARRAVDSMGGVSSARGTSSLTDLRAKLAVRREVPLVRDFLEQTA